jgi:hypothetical protein
MTQPINMILHCPECGRLHVDKPEPDICKCGHPSRTHTEGYCSGTYGSVGPGYCRCLEFVVGWMNPPHKSHLCKFCGVIWRPADVPTNGVEVLQTRGKADTWPKVATLSPSPAPTEEGNAKARPVFDPATEYAGE